jgi:DNA-binding sugar fermentation-stimulating protein
VQYINKKLTGGAVVPLVSIGEKMIEAIFLEEVNPRFIGKVLINGVVEECYIASSAKLSNFINLVGETVILKCNTNKKARTKYTLYGLKKRKNIILLNLNSVNIYFEELYRENKLQGYEFSEIGKKEVFVEDYKADYYIPSLRLVIENKTIISENEIAYFPMKGSKRAIEQMRKIGSLIKQGYKTKYNIFILTPDTKKITLADPTSEFIRLFSENIEKGMEYYIYYLFMQDDELHCMRYGGTINSVELNS